jgi:hypothetical protein
VELYDSSRYAALRFFRRVGGFRLFQRLGVHVVLNHYYGPVPDTDRIPEAYWGPSELVGWDLKECCQLALLEDFSARYKQEYDQFPEEKPPSGEGFYLSNGFFASVDAEVLYSMIRRFRPKIVLEIGSGNSTLVSAQALLKNEAETGDRSELIATDPFPSDTLRKGFPGLTRLVKSPVQDLAISEFERLGENDILFIDSSHVLKPGSDVQHEYLEILPRLKRGVIVQIHDIFLPNGYPKDWIIEHHRFWNEQSLLQAFLAFNSAFEILWAGSYMSLNHPEKLQVAFSSYRPGKTTPGSIWIRKVV